MHGSCVEAVAVLQVTSILLQPHHANHGAFTRPQRGQIHPSVCMVETFAIAIIGIITDAFGKTIKIYFHRICLLSQNFNIAIKRMVKLVRGILFQYVIKTRKTELQLVKFSNQTVDVVGGSHAGDGFFKIQDVNGNVSYTRNGSFVVDSQDYLVTNQGEYVLDVNNRRIRMIPEDFDPELFRDRMEIVIGESGNIEINSYNQKVPLQTIGIFDFSDKEDLFEVGDTKFVPRDIANNPELRAEKFSVQQGMLELSNSNVIREMINTINTSRNYESLTKIVSTNNELLQTAVSVGRLRS